MGYSTRHHHTFRSLQALEELEGNRGPNANHKFYIKIRIDLCDIFRQMLSEVADNWEPEQCQRTLQYKAPRYVSQWWL